MSGPVELGFESENHNLMGAPKTAYPWATWLGSKDPSVVRSNGLRIRKYEHSP
jgi:hypothetical protein